MAKGIDKIVQEQLAIIRRGTVEIISPAELAKKIERSLDFQTLQVKAPLRIKAGFDPSAPDLHLGHVVLLRKLRDFLELGHEVYFLIGDLTAMIGDPSGQNKARPMLSSAEVETNTKTYLEQVRRVFDAFDKQDRISRGWREHEHKLKERKNSEWLNLTLEQTLRQLASKYTIAQLLERDDFGKRFKENRPITVAELLYPLMQGYDSVILMADIELGGTDQKFNLLVGRELQRTSEENPHKNNDPQVVITVPLLEGTDGAQKMSKSLGNAIGIQDPPDQMFGKLMSISDELMVRYYELLTNEEMERIQRDAKVRPKELKEELAFLVTRDFHGEEKAKEARQNFRRVFQERELPEEIPTVRARIEEDGKIDLVNLLVKSGLAPSASQARRLIQQGAVKKNRTEKMVDYRVKLKLGEVLQVGPRRFVKIVI